MNETATLTEPATFMRSVLQRIATGPEYSKDISQEEGPRGAEHYSGREKPTPYKPAIYFIALRMKTRDAGGKRRVPGSLTGTHANRRGPSATGG